MGGVNIVYMVYKEKIERCCTSHYNGGTSVENVFILGAQELSATCLLALQVAHYPHTLPAPPDPQHRGEHEIAFYLVLRTLYDPIHFNR